jgi:hypothetical protein
MQLTSPVNRACRHGPWPVSIMPVPKRKARPGTAQITNRAMPCWLTCRRLGSSMAHHTFIRTVLFHLVRCAFGPLCHKQPVDKKTGKYFSFIGIFKPP